MLLAMLLMAVARAVSRMVAMGTAKREMATRGGGGKRWQRGRWQRCGQWHRQ
jgi:hypothetical protein